MLYTTNFSKKSICGDFQMSSLEFPETCETVETNKGTEESQNIEEVSKV